MVVVELYRGGSGVVSYPLFLSFIPYPLFFGNLSLIPYIFLSLNYSLFFSIYPLSLIFGKLSLIPYIFLFLIPYFFNHLSLVPYFLAFYHRERVPVYLIDNRIHTYSVSKLCRSYADRG